MGLYRSKAWRSVTRGRVAREGTGERHYSRGPSALALLDRKSTRLNSSHLVISYAVFCLKKKIRNEETSLTMAYGRPRAFQATFPTSPTGPASVIAYPFDLDVKGLRISIPPSDHPAWPTQ